MKRVLRGLFALLLGFGISVAAFEASEFATGQGVQGTMLGPLDFDNYCAKQYGKHAGAVQVSDDIYGWKCTFRKNGIFDDPAVKTDDACRLLYGSPAYANAYDVHYPLSWQCFRGHR
jgi:hypothetical protein